MRAVEIRTDIFGRFGGELRKLVAKLSRRQVALKNYHNIFNLLE